MDTNSPLNMNLPKGTKFQAPAKLDHSIDDPNSLGGNWKTSALGLSAVLSIHRNGKSQSAASKIIPACDVREPSQPAETTLVFIMYESLLESKLQRCGNHNDGKQNPSHG